MAVITGNEKVRAERLETLVADINVLERRPPTGLHSLQLDYKGDSKRGVNLWQLAEVVTYGGATKVATGDSHWSKGLNGVEMLHYLKNRATESARQWAGSDHYHCHLCAEYFAKKQAAAHQAFEEGMRLADELTELLGGCK